MTAVPGGEEDDPSRIGSIDVDALASELVAVELSSAEWQSATITIPDVTETQAFGRSKIKQYYNVHVNGKYYRGYRYSEINALMQSLKKEFPDVIREAPRFPAKNRLSLGGATAKQVEDRRVSFEPWFNYIIKNAEVTASKTFQAFVMLKPDYAEIQQEMNEKVTDLNKIPEADWKLSEDKKGVKIFTLKQQGSSLLVVKTYVLVERPLEKVLETYNCKAEWSNWQPDMKVCKTIEFVEGSNELELPVKEVVYAAYRVPVLSNRDVCMMSIRQRGSVTDKADDSRCTVVSMSITHPSCPEVKGMVRGFMNVGITEFASVNDGKGTEVTSILHMDPRGMIPPAVVNTMASHAVGSIVDMREYIHSKYSS